MQLRREQVYVYRWLKKDLVQHLIFGAFVFVIIFCFFAVHSWYQGRATLLETLDYQREAFWVVFRDALIYTLFMAIPVYVNLVFIYGEQRGLLFKRPTVGKTSLRNGGFYLFLAVSFASALLFALLFAPLLKNILQVVHQEWYQMVFIILFLIICTTGISFTKRTIEKNRAMERLERRNAIRQRREVERQLQLIKKQIRPHFLFNTLANLQILARDKADELPTLIGQLSFLLRYVVYHTEARVVSLQEEVNFIKSYLKLQSLQLSNGTDLRFICRGTINDQHHIPPMILIQFVENCFKHYNRIGTGRKFIHITLEVSDHVLLALLENSYKLSKTPVEDFTQEEKSNGIGIAAAKENLQLIYQGRSDLTSEITDDTYSVRLKIPLI